MDKKGQDRWGVSVIVGSIVGCISTMFYLESIAGQTRMIESFGVMMTIFVSVTTLIAFMTFFVMNRSK